MSGERDLLRSIRFSGRYIGDLDLGEVQMNYRVTTKPVPESNPSQTPDQPILICSSKIIVQLSWFDSLPHTLGYQTMWLKASNLLHTCMFVCLLKPRECPPEFGYIY